MTVPRQIARLRDTHGSLWMTRNCTRLADERNKIQSNSIGEQNIQSSEGKTE